MLNVGIYVYDNAEVLDFSGPFEVFTTACRVSGNSSFSTSTLSYPPFNTFLINESSDVVIARAGYRVLPDYHFNNHPTIDLLIVVGGDHTEEINKPEVIDWIAKQSKQAKCVASVCTGAFLLAKAGVITQQKVTTHWEDIDDLQECFPLLNVIRDVRWVDEGSIVTSGGISAGIDMSLHLVSRLVSQELAQATAKQMEFYWTQNNE